MMISGQNKLGGREEHWPVFMADRKNAPQVRQLGMAAI